MKRVVGILGIVLGILIILQGVQIYDMDVGSTPSSSSFGADFYTYSYRATRAVADNVRLQSVIVRDGLSALICTIGSGIIFYSVFQVVSTFAPHKKKKETKSVDAVDAVTKADNLLETSDDTIKSDTESATDGVKEESGDKIIPEFKSESNDSN